MRKPSPATIMAATALFISLGGVGVAASGTDFILGRNNTAKAKTSLTAPVAGNSLQITNTLPAGSALGLSVDPSSPPFTTNSSTKVPNLNSDLLDGMNSTAFLGVNGTAANAQKLDGLDSTQFLGANATAANANKLDGLDSTQFVQGGGQILTFAQTVNVPANNGVGVTLGTLVEGDTLTFGGGCVNNFDGATGAQLNLLNNFSQSTPLTLWTEDGAPDPTLAVLNSGQAVKTPFKLADHVIWHGWFGSTIFTADAWTSYNNLTCTYDLRVTIYP